MIKLVLAVIICWSCKSRGESVDANLLLNACKKQIQNPACKKALQLHDSAHTALEKTLVFLHIKKYANTLGTAMGLAVTQKGSLKVWEKGPKAIEADCNFRQQSLFVNYLFKF